MTWALFLAGAYLSGSVPYGLLLVRAFAGKDVREAGSGNIGATNVARVAGKKVGALVLALDAAKGALPVWLAVWLQPEVPWLHVAVGVGAFAGHVFPVWLGFKGGKGVATALGVLVVLLPWSALAGFVVWAAVVGVFKVSSVGSLSGGLLAVVLAVAMGRPVPYVVLGGALYGAMLWTHRENLKRLLKREENRL